MRTKLKLLEDLQALDLKIDGRQAEREALLARLGEYDRQVQDAREAVAAKNNEQAALTQEKEGLEQNLELESENINRSEVRLSEIKTQKEYQAVLKEVSTAKKLKTEIEEQILAKIAEIDELKGEIAKREEDLSKLEENVASGKSEVEEAIRAMDEEIATDSDSRQAITAGLNASLLKRYDMLRERRQGVAVVEARDGNCIGCNMNIPPQLFNNLYKEQEIYTCPHCQRILFLKQNGEEPQQ